jgi:hypothetical protein
VLPNGETERLAWYKRPRYVWAVAVLLFALAQLTIGLTLLHISDTQKKNQSTIDQTSVVVNKIDNNQVGIDELVKFVHEVEAQQAASTQAGTSQAVVDIETLLCSSADAVRQQACTDLGLPSVPK